MESPDPMSSRPSSSIPDSSSSSDLGSSSDERLLDSVDLPSLDPSGSQIQFQPAASSRVSKSVVQKTNATFWQSIKQFASEEVGEFASVAGRNIWGINSEDRKATTTKLAKAVDDAKSKEKDAADAFKASPNDDLARYRKIKAEMQRESAERLEALYKDLTEGYDEYGSILRNTSFLPFSLLPAFRKEGFRHPMRALREVENIDLKGRKYAAVNIARFWDQISDPLVHMDLDILDSVFMRKSPSEVKTEKIWAEFDEKMKIADPEERAREVGKFVEQFSDVNFDLKHKYDLHDKYGIDTNHEVMTFQKYFGEENISVGREERRHIHSVLRRVVDEIGMDLRPGSAIKYSIPGKGKYTENFSMDYVMGLVAGNTAKIQVVTPLGQLINVKIDLAKGLPADLVSEILQEKIEAACALADAGLMKKQGKQLVLMNGDLNIDFTKEERKRKEEERMLKRFSSAPSDVSKFLSRVVPEFLKRRIPKVLKHSVPKVLKQLVNPEALMRRIAPEALLGMKQELDFMNLLLTSKKSERDELAPHLRKLERGLDEQKTETLAHLKKYEGDQIPMDRLRGNDSLEQEYLHIDDELRSLRWAMDLFGIKREPKVEITSEAGAPPIDINPDDSAGPPVDVTS